MSGLRRVLASAAVVAVAAVGLSTVASARADKVEICHLDKETGQFGLINVSGNGRTVAAHEAHGDGYLGDVVPDTNGSFEFDSRCNPMAVNSSPDAVDDDVATDEDTTLNGDVLADNSNGVDSDADGDPLTVTAVDGNPGNVGVQVTLGSGALLTVNAGGTFTYDPNGQYDSLAAGESTTDAFTYTIDDGNGGTDTATVTVTIAGVTPSLLAIAYVNVDGQDGYDADADILIAQFEDVDDSADPSVGDIIRTNQYPRLLDASDASTFQTTRHRIIDPGLVFYSSTGVHVGAQEIGCQCSRGVTDTGSDQEFWWSSSGDAEFYFEKSDGDQTLIIDFVDASIANDTIEADPDNPSPSDPDTATFQATPQPGDQPFIDVDIFFTPPSP